MRTQPATAPVTTSHVLDTAKPITSRSGLNRAVKARVTLATAAAILRHTGVEQLSNADAARQIERRIADLTVAIADYYQRASR